MLLCAVRALCCRGRDPPVASPLTTARTRSTLSTPVSILKHFNRSNKPQCSA
jgi:hypothetical protein